VSDNVARYHPKLSITPISVGAYAVLRETDLNLYFTVPATSMLIDYNDRT